MHPWYSLNISEEVNSQNPAMKICLLTYSLYKILCDGKSLSHDSRQGFNSPLNMLIVKTSCSLHSLQKGDFYKLANSKL